MQAVARRLAQRAQTTDLVERAVERCDGAIGAKAALQFDAGQVMQQGIARSLGAIEPEPSAALHRFAQLTDGLVTEFAGAATEGKGVEVAAAQQGFKLGAAGHDHGVDAQRAEVIAHGLGLGLVAGRVLRLVGVIGRAAAEQHQEARQYRRPGLGIDLNGRCADGEGGGGQHLGAAGAGLAEHHAQGLFGRWGGVVLVTNGDALRSNRETQWPALQRLATGTAHAQGEATGIALRCRVVHLVAQTHHLTCLHWVGTDLNAACEGLQAYVGLAQ